MNELISKFGTGISKCKLVDASFEELQIAIPPDILKNMINTIENAYLDNNISLKIFGYENGSSACAFNNYYMYVYSFKIYEGTTLIKDYVPVVNINNRPCLFDKVSKECFYNSGSGEFLYG